MGPSIYISCAHKFSLGGLGIVEVSRLKSDFWENHPIFEAFADEYGDAGFRIGIPDSLTGECACRKIRFKHRCGEVGFDAFSSGGVDGSASDEEASILLRQICKGGYTLDWESTGYVSAMDADDVDGLFASRPSGKPKVVIRGRREALISPSKRWGEMSLDDLVIALFDLVRSGAVVLIWESAYGSNPVVLSREIDSFIDGISGFCRSLGVSIQEVLAEADLPEW